MAGSVFGQRNSDILTCSSLQPARPQSTFGALRLLAKHGSLNQRPQLQLAHLGPVELELEQNKWSVLLQRSLRDQQRYQAHLATRLVKLI